MPQSLRKTESQAMPTSYAEQQPVVRQTFLPLLLGRKFNAVILVSLGLALVAAGAIAVGFGLGYGALIASSAGGSMAVLGGLGLLFEARGKSMQDTLVDAMMRALVHDPDPVMITDSQGHLLAQNTAAEPWADPAAALARWCVNPDQIVTSVLADALRTGHAKRDYHRKNKTLRLLVHTSDDALSTLVWRFTLGQTAHPRDLDSVGLAIITQDEDKLTYNAAAQALGGPDIMAGVLEALEAQPPNNGESANIKLPNGQNLQALRLNGQDGHDDVVLLPPGTILTNPEPAAPLDFEEIPVALAQLDPSGRIAGTNRLARGLLGLESGDTRYFWQVVEGLGRPVEDWLDDARAGRALGRPEVLRASLTGPETYVQIILRRATNATSPGALIAVVSDATELKSLEARFVQSQKMQAIGQLAGGVAHDFNNLLTAISGHCDLLLINRDRFDPDYNDLLQIHQNANRAAALVRQLLAFSRKQTMKPENLSLESLLEDLTHLLTRLVGERITLTLIHDRALRGIRADRRQLEQVIMNLVVNARDAMPMGGEIRIETELVTLETERDHGRVRLPAGRYARINVIDEGIGMSPEIIDKIFEPFFSTKRLGEGTGLGLSTAYGIVKQMGGYIFAQSVEGSGTTFSIYFASLPKDAVLAPEKPHAPAFTQPLTEDAPTPPNPEDMTDAAARSAPKPTTDQPATRSTAPTGALKGGTVLLVEDEAPVRAFAARALRLQGYQVFEAQDGEQALEFLEDRSLRIDLFVTDVIMPGIDGPGWVTKALATRPGTPVVFVSGYTEDTLSAALTRIPKSVFLGKPFSLQDLSATIDQQLTA